MSYKVKDYYYQKAKKENFLARSIFKLEEIDKKYKILKKNYQVVDFGYYPGSWIQYTSKAVGPDGLVVGVDLHEPNNSLKNLSNVKVYCQDAEAVNTISCLGVSSFFDVVLSDMAPKTTGIKIVDQENSLRLVEKVFELLPKYLRPGGHLVIKVFEGRNAQLFLKDQKVKFSEFNYLRPKSTRSCSKEYFVIAKGYKGVSS